MAVMLLDEDHLAEFLARVESVEPQARPRWGCLDATSMLAHLRCSLEVSLGEVPVIDQSTLPMRTVVKWLFFDLALPWPKGRIQAPKALMIPAGSDMAEERRLLADALRRFLDVSRTDPTRRTIHPLMGPMSLAYWRRIHGLHMNHHLTQFGV